ncbi:hypothetical protein BO79DRAFT_224690 [Aspergillus costaricaensis CBS 115574]|uniref:Uncharacterized protein n=1 Tax=Aspergillus costaricaensis CBS 115574 TaxID=1448317 RepID=A0ACD1ISE5_9EURO|nr:hypothetical protein BO79DRAFT_224690 [Aspergillus costaricaensis CBS 115574]RAK93179.1 hypothetical protein BO79DRAFT_224690 [Aspergillus costaricaensis CBS 115574]
MPRCIHDLPLLSSLIMDVTRERTVGHPTAKVVPDATIRDYLLNYDTPIDLALHCRNTQRLVSEKAIIPDDHHLDLVDDEMRFDDLNTSGSHGFACDRNSGLDLARTPLYWVSCSGPTVHPAETPNYRKKICMLCGLRGSGTKRHLQYHPGIIRVTESKVISSITEQPIMHLGITQGTHQP